MTVWSGSNIISRNRLANTDNRHLFQATRDALLTDPSPAEVIPLDMTLHQRAIDLYTRRVDKRWSLTDCVSFLVMQDRGLTEALTATGTSSRPGSSPS